MEKCDKALIYIHLHICKHYEIDVTDKWYDDKSNTITEGRDVTILWDMPIHRDKEIKANRPDIIVIGKSKKQCILIDMAVPSERNVAAKEVEKLPKYKDLEIEIFQIWNIKTIVIPLMIGAIGIIRKGMIRYVEQLPGKIMLEELPKLVLIGTVHIIRRTLSIT